MHASSCDIGAVLLQVQDDCRKSLVCYISRALSTFEQMYLKIEKEALTMTWTCKMFHCYIFDNENTIVVETDHKPFKTIRDVQSLDECPP